VLVKVGSVRAAAGAATETMEMTSASRASTAAAMEVRLAFPKFGWRFNPACTWCKIIFIDYETISSILVIFGRYSDFDAMDGGGAVPPPGRTTNRA